MTGSPVPDLATLRLRLRMITPDDAEVFYALNLDPEVIRHTGDEPFVSVEEARRFLEGYDQYARYARGRLAVELLATGEIVGWCGLKYHPDTGETDLGYRLFRRHWGNGYATEAGAACLADGFGRLGLEEIIAQAAVANPASIRVMKKLGMTYRRGYVYEGGDWVVYGQTRGGWAAWQSPPRDAPRQA